MTLTEWELLHGLAAELEGWGLFWAEHEDHSAIELQADDAAAVFYGDEGAWEFVWAHRGIHGTAEQDALALLAAESPIEFSRILAHIHNWPI